MADEEYWKGVYEKAHQDLVDLVAECDWRAAELDELRKERAQLEALLERVAAFRPESNEPLAFAIVHGVAQLKLAEACREVLKQTNQSRTARGVRDSLEASGYNLKQHKNPLASIHGVLKRLVSAGQVEEVEVSGKIRYRWRQPLPTVPAEPKLLDRFRAPKDVNNAAYKPVDLSDGKGGVLKINK